MDTKNKAFELFKNGFSYSEIALELSISKSTAHKYVQEMKSKDSIPNRANESNSNDKAFSVRTEKQTNERKIKIECTGVELMNIEFIEYEFEGKFLELIGKPSKPFSVIIWGLPKGGKSNFSIRFADYLYEYFGSVCYFVTEEGFSSTLKSKLVDIGGSNVLFNNLRDRNKIREYLKENKFDFVFIDSINKACIDHEFLEHLKEESPETSFIGIAQATKGGNYRGDQALTHNCDIVIKVVDGIAYQVGRFNTNSEISIFDSPLYEKNPNKKPEKKCENKSKIVLNDSTPPKNLGEIIADVMRKSNANKDNDKKSIKENSAYLDFIKKYKIY